MTRSRTPRSLCLAVFLVSTLGAPLAFAQGAEVKKYLNVAVTLYENLEYEKALGQLTKARTKAASGEDEAKIGLLEGVILADMGKEERALAALKMAFGFDLEAKLPVEVSPKVSRIVEKARASVRKTLAPQLEQQRLDEEARKAAEAKKAEEDKARELARRKREEEERLALLKPPALTEKAPAPDGGLRGKAWIPGVVGLASAGVATYFLLDASSKYDTLMRGNPLVAGNPDPAEARVLRDGGKFSANVGYAFVGVAAVGALASLGLYALGGPSEPKVTLAPVPGGGFVSVAGQFDLGGAR